MKALLLFLLLPMALRADYALRDGDRLAFLGDSITAARGYPKIVEHYTLMRFPDRKVTFVNAGEGGDTASGCLKRLERDVFDQGATVVTVAFGINDIGWGTKADDEHRQLYLDGIRTIIERCRERQVRVFICSPAITAEASDTAAEGYLQKMADEGLALAKSMGAGTIDLQRGMREVQRRVEESNAAEPNPENRMQLHVKDGVHLSDFGQLVMAYAMIKGLEAPEEVSSAMIDAATGEASGEGCRITDVSTEGGLSFTRLDEGLPLNLGPFTGLQYRWIPVPDGINRYMLTVRNLPAGEYRIEVDGRDVGKESADALARGVNLASATGNAWLPGGPWDVQSCMVRDLVDARDKLEAAFRMERRDLSGTAGLDPLPGRFKREEAGLIELQRACAVPRSYRFTLRPVPAE